MHRLFKFKKKLRPGALQKIIFIISAPTIVLLTLVAVLTVINYYSVSNSAKTISYNVVKNFFQYNEALINNFASSLLLPDDGSELVKALTFLDYIYNKTEFQNSSSAIHDAFPFAEDTCIFNKSKNLVYCSDGIFDANDYFNSYSVYDDFDAAYFKDFIFYTTERYRILLPTSVAKNGVKSQALPIIVRKLGAVPQKNLLIVNINLQKLFTAARNKFDMYDTPVYIYNKYSNEIIEISNTENTFDFSTEFSQKLLTNGNSTFSYTLGKEKYMISAYSSSTSIIGYVFFSVMPHSIVTHKMFPILMISAGIIFLFILIMIFFLIRSAKSIVSPLESVFDIIPANNTLSGKNILNDISDITKKMYEENRDLSVMRISAQKQFLLGLMTSTEYVLDKKTANTILTSFDFPHNIFAVLIIQLMPSAGFFDLFNTGDYNVIRRGFYSLVESLFSEHFNCCVVPEKNNQLYIVLNFANPSDYHFADNILSDLYRYLQQDRDYVTLSAGKSECYSSLSELCHAYNDAIDNMTEYDLSHSQLVSGVHMSGDIVFSSKDENDLFLALISFDHDSAVSVFEKINESNSELSLRMTKKLYNYILNIILKVIHLKNIPLSSGRLDFEILNEYLNQPPQDIKSEIYKLIDFICENGAERKEETIDYDEIVQYISQNYSLPDLSLKHLSDKFYINSNNLSTALKSKLGVGFHEYLKNLRVEKAKELLKTTNKTNNEIYQLCGFSSSQTFYRVFRDTVGMSAGDFRKISRKNNS